MGRWKSLTNGFKRHATYYRAVASHPRTPRISRWLIGLAIVYLATPIDIIPDFLPVIGHLDDLLIVSALIGLAIMFVPADVKREARINTADR
ncbi:MAG: DUF1232 domain-containing protein [Gammaproteobacteria bacterium]|nr:DUF1232 domain-containing protein [Gammaproteobacteria bacterium]MDH3561325.1 DUF1232 domain-containing protein [Gammaproteobacteria bacterium]